jgi:large subunit ribosomal protein L3
MTHVMMIDYRPTSTTAKSEVVEPVTVVEVPPMKIAAIRVYRNTSDGLSTLKEVWADNLDKELKNRVSIPEKYDSAKAAKALEEFEKIKSDVDDVRVLAYTQPKMVSGTPKKVPELMEIRVGNGTIDERLEYARSLLGKSIGISDLFKEGDMVDVAGVTKGKGWQDAVSRWGVKTQSHKNSKNKKDAGNMGPVNPSFVRWTVPLAGQMGYHQRIEYNKRILKIGDKDEEITPKGGFLHYGIVRNKYLIIHGTIPGAVPRMVKLRDAMRSKAVKIKGAPELTYISLESKQGVR